MHSLRNCFIQLFEHHRGAIVDNAQWMVYHVISWVNVYISTVYDDESQLFEVFGLLSVGIIIFSTNGSWFQFYEVHKVDHSGHRRFLNGLRSCCWKQGQPGAQQPFEKLADFQGAAAGVTNLRNHHYSCSPMF